MMQPTLPLTRELVLIGGGHTHALVLRKWGMRPLPGARLTLINPGPTAPYTGMLPGFVAGHYRQEELSIDLVRLARFAGARLIMGAVEGIDRDRRLVRVPGRAPVAYDIASINIGITSDLPALPGFAKHAVAAKPLGAYAAAWQRFQADLAAGHVTPDISVIGGGVGGVELALAMAYALRQDGHNPRLTIVEKSTALPGIANRTRAKLLHHINRLDIRIIEGARAVAVTADAVQLQDGSLIKSHFTVGTAGARPHGWLAHTGLDLDSGFIRVDATLRSFDPAVYAAGDCAHLPDPRPKAGVFAVREAPVLLHNLRAELTGSNRRRYRPQNDFLKLISLGDKSALADKYGGRAEGRWLWRLKDRIDQKFMEQFRTLPQMPQPSLPRETTQDMAQTIGSKPFCGGCGAKVGGATLTGMLQDLPHGQRADVTNAPGDDAAILAMNGAQQVFTTDHLRAFTEDPWLMARIAAVHALGDIWAMGAAPQAALATIVLPHMREEMQRNWLAEIMDAATEVIADAGADIAGGHTSLGQELTIGFSVTGLLDRAPITLAGARPGDVLILTKPIGSGTVLAGEMAMGARGEWVTAALHAMATPQATAARQLSGAHAMTDVTGFGLAGHLMGICKTSGVAAQLHLPAIPFMDGAIDLAIQGIRSTLYPQNRGVADAMRLPVDPRADLLFDPQTAGGLLAAVAAAEADKILTALRDQAIPATRIGEITDGAPFITVRAD